jgi:hypothetical protein
MRLANSMFALLLATLAIPLGCDWIPGSSLSFRQSVRTWEPVISDECLVLGTYIFAVDAGFPPFDAKASVKMKTLNKDAMEFLPPNFDINYRLNGNLYYQQAFELKNGKGSFREFQPNFWDFDANDEIEYSICGSGGTIPTFTEISVKFDYKFDKQDMN